MDVDEGVINLVSHVDCDMYENSLVAVILVTGSVSAV